MTALPPPLLTEDAISARVDELAARIDADYRDTELLVLIGVLKGSFIFLSDLARRLTVPRRVEFIAVSSTESAKASTASLFACSWTCATT